MTVSVPSCHGFMALSVGMVTAGVHQPAGEWKVIYTSCWGRNFLWERKTTVPTVYVPIRHGFKPERERGVSEPSPRKELGEYVETGQLRDLLTDSDMTEEAIQLCVDVVRRYCEPRRRGRYKPFGKSQRGSVESVK